ncbi:MAG: acetylxylan esterase [Victivallaceae bacterium]|nr:acetylxylan esterase [Victivallaceae bacterium]
MKNMFAPLLALLVAGFGCASPVENYVIEAEGMDDLGNFETNLGDASAGALLYSHDPGSCARGVYAIPRTGDYKLLLRDLSFGDRTRTLDVYVDKKLVGSGGDEPGRGRPLLEWCEIADIHLDKGNHEFALQSTGPNARPDALLLLPKGAPVPDDNMMPEKFRRLGAANCVGVMSYNFSSGRPPFGAYHCGDEIVFSVNPTMDGKPLDRFEIHYAITGDDGQKSAGKIPLTGKPVSIKTTLGKPGFVCLAMSLRDADGKLVLGARKFMSCVGADEDKIPQVAEPEDFDAFWSKQKKMLDTVPIEPQLNEIPGSNPEEYRTYEVVVPCPGRASVTGFLVIPRDAKEKSLPAQVGFQGYGVHMPTHAFPMGKRIYFEINAHGMPLKMDKEELKEYAAKHARYALDDTADPEKAYFRDMVLRVLRALEFVRTLPEWNGRDLMVSGGSQGGLQSLWAAGLDDKVTFCRVYVPWCCSIGKETLGMMPQTWGVTYTEGARYFDAANHAKRITCPVLVDRAGLGDFICPPSGIARMYHNLKAPRKIIWFVDNAHGGPTYKVDTFPTQSADFKVPPAFADGGK